MKKLLSLALCALLLAGNAAALPAMGTLTAKSAALYDANGQNLYELNAEEPLQPASVTKIMTMLLAMEALERGDVALDTMITGSAHAASMGGTQIWLEQGEQMPFEDMMKAIVVASANDCSVAVAEHLAGSEESFVDLMNSRAKELGCRNTAFVNANGLDEGEQKTMTSARDLALISAELLKHPKVLEYTTIWMDTIRDGAFGLANTNKMLRQYKGLIGLKTGFIREAGFCISAAATRDGMTLIATVMAAPTKEDRMADATALLNYGFAHFAPYTPDLTAALTPVAVRMGLQNAVNVQAEPIQPVVVSKEKIANVSTEIRLPAQVDAPVTKGQELGTAVILDGETPLATVRLTAAEAVERLHFSDIYHRFLLSALMKNEPSAPAPPPAETA